MRYWCSQPGGINPYAVPERAAAAGPEAVPGPRRPGPPRAGLAADDIHRDCTPSTGKAGTSVQIHPL